MKLFLFRKYCYMALKWKNKWDVNFLASVKDFYLGFDFLDFPFLIQRLKKWTYVKYVSFSIFGGHGKQYIV